jgi:hypothetical protein
MDTVRPTLNYITVDSYIASFPGCARTAQVTPDSWRQDAYQIHANGQVVMAFSAADALCTAWVACVDVPAALTDGQVIEAACQFVDLAGKARDEMLDDIAALDVKNYANIVRALLKVRLGRSYSVRVDAHGWIEITARRSSKDETEDKVLLSKIFGGMTPTFQHSYSIACRTHQRGDYRATLVKIVG